MEADLYSIRMRASRGEGAAAEHVSGAERIVGPELIGPVLDALSGRALHHSKGKPDSIVLTVERISGGEAEVFDALPVSTVEAASVEEGMAEVRRFLGELGVPDAEGVMAMMGSMHSMRGAMLLDVCSMERLEPDRARGVRATRMDAERDGGPCSVKDHYREALVLASKVARCPGVVGEVCISDDPEYVTGYVASLKTGYRRITRMKEPGSPLGGRIFLYDPEAPGAVSAEAAIRWLQEAPVIIRNLPARPTEQPREPMLQKPSAEPTRESGAALRERASAASDAGGCACGQPDAPGRWDILRGRLDAMRDAGLHRTMRAITSAQGAHVVCGGREVVLMASNSYLDLTAHPYMKERVEAAVRRYGFGSGGSRLTTGDTDAHERLEAKIADFKRTEAAVVFGSGYTANVAAISAIAGGMREGGVIFSDELNHASIIDGCRLSRARCVVYRHNDMDDLRRKIRETGCTRGLAVSDAVFSMDGDILDLPRFLEVCDEAGLFSMVDEAHSTGTIGRSGHGIVEHFGCRAPDILMGTLSKAVGAEGGFVAGRELLADYLRNTARGFIFTTSMPPAAAEAALAGLELIEREPWRVERLQDNVRRFCAALRAGGLDIDSQTPVVPVMVGDERRALALAEHLLDHGFLVPAIRYPTVPRGMARLRAAVMSTHSAEELDRAAELITDYLGNR